MKALTPCCATCDHWSNVEPPLATGIRRAKGASEELGTCRRDPPVVLSLAGIPASLFPETHYSRVCGDWSPMAPDGDGGGPDDGERIISLDAERRSRSAA